MADSDSKRILGKVTSWLGLICGVFTVIVWCFLLQTLKPKIMVDKEDAINDVNKHYWRYTMFSFAPTVFFDIWTPFVMGFISILCHFQNFDLTWMSKTYVHYFLWNFTLALFANIGYSGGIGIICSSFTFLCTLLSLICAFVLPGQSPKLQLPSRPKNFCQRGG